MSREGREFNPADTILGTLSVSNSLNETPAALDAAAWRPPAATPRSACNGMRRWSVQARLRGPGWACPTMRRLCRRYIDVTAGNSANTSLRLSGISYVVAVPEPASVLMLLAGLGAIIAVTRRRERC